MPPDHGRPGWALGVACIGSAVGGAAGWALVFLGLDLWGLAIGAVIAVGLAVAGASGIREPRRDTLILTLAVSLLLWPLAWLGVVLVRYWITGQDVGS